MTYQFSYRQQANHGDVYRNILPIAAASTGHRVYAPTFDCCATCARPFGSSNKLFAHLINNRVPSTVFLTGEWMKAHPEMTKRLMAATHIELGFHGMTHNNLRLVSPNPALLRHEIEGPRKIYNQLLHEAVLEGKIKPTVAAYRKDVSLFRFPSGDYNETALQAVYQAGLIPIQWNGTLDGSTRAHLHKGHSINGSILLGHGNRSNDAVRETENTFPIMQARLAEQGYRPVTVSQLLRLRGAQPIYSQAPEPRTAQLERLDRRTLAENAKYNHGLLGPQQRPSHVV